MVITMKMFTPKYAKFFKITDQTSVVTKAGKRLTLSEKSVTYQSLIFSFSEFLYSIFLQFPTQTNVKNELIQSFLKTFNK